MKKIEINDYLRNEIMQQIRFLNTKGLIIILDTIYDLRCLNIIYKGGDRS